MTDTHHIGAQAQAAKLLLDTLHENFTDDADAAYTIVEGETSLLEVIDKALDRMAAIAAYQEGIDAAVERMKARSSRLEAQSERLKASLLMAMDTIGMKKLERPTATLSVAKVPDKVIVTSEADLPSGFLVEKTTVSPDRKLILQALKDGAELPGALLSNGGVTLRISRG
jgi:hypothetical protein